MATNLGGGPRLPRDAVAAVAAWMAASVRRRARWRPRSERARSGPDRPHGRRAPRRRASTPPATRSKRPCGAEPCARAVTSRRRAAPARPLRHRLVGEAHALEHAGDRVSDDVVDGLRLLVESGHRREHDPAHLGERQHLAEVPDVQRRLPHEREQRPALLERHVPGPGDQGVGVAARERGERLDRAGRDDHPGGPERAAGDRGPDVAVVVDDVGERLDLAQRVGRLLDERPLAGGAHHQVHLERRVLPQLLEQANAVDRARGPRDADHHALHATHRKATPGAGGREASAVALE